MGCAVSDPKLRRPMLAGKCDPVKLQFPLIAQVKLDGIRCLIVEGQALTRALKEVPNREIFEFLSRPEFEGLDGEILVGNPVAKDCYRKTSSFVMSRDDTGADWCYHVFDKWDEPGGYTHRAVSAMYVMEHSDRRSNERTHSVDWVTCDTPGALEAFEEETVAAGHEGVIIRSITAPYKHGRGTAKVGDLLKLKRFVDYEARVTGCYEEMRNDNVAVTNLLGRTQRSTHQANKVGKGTLGGFNCVALNGPHEGQTFDVGTGFDAAQRAGLWLERDGLVGRTIKVKSFPIGAKDTARHPVFLGFRDVEAGE